MKNISKKITIIFVVFLLILSTGLTSNAAKQAVSLDNNLVDYDDDIMLLDDDLSNQEDNNYDYDLYDDYDDEVDETFDNSEITNENFFYAGSKDVNIDNPIYGDAFIFTSGSVTINETISGNAFICASSVTISENGQIYASLFNASNSLTLNGDIGLNVYNFSNKLSIKGTVEFDLFSFSRNTNIDGTIYGNANISADSLSISDNSSIEKNLNYSSKEKINISNDVVSGAINYAAQTDKDTNSAILLKDFVVSVLSFIILAVVIFILAKWLNCKFLNTYSNFVKNLPISLLYGLLGLILIPVACVILLICGVTINISFILMAIYGILLTIASSIVIISLSKLIAEQLQTKFDKINTTLLIIISIAVLSIAYKLLKLIPILGTIITLAFVMVGIGIIIKSIIPTKEQKNS